MQFLQSQNKKTAMHRYYVNGKRVTFEAFDAIRIKARMFGQHDSFFTGETPTHYKFYSSARV